MPAPLTRLDPTLPLCWEDADTLRVGFDEVLARVHRPSPGAQRLIRTLAQGVARTRLGSAAHAAGATPDDVATVLAALAPALINVAPAETGQQIGAIAGSSTVRLPVRTLLCDDGRPLPGFRDALHTAGICGFDAGVDGPPELVILVERFLEPLGRAQRWLVAGVPHLLIRLTDRAIHVGPVIAPGGAPCHTCISLALIDRDPALPALAAQLTGTRPCSESPAGVHLAAALAATLIRSWQAAGTSERHGTNTFSTNTFSTAEFGTDTFSGADGTDPSRTIRHDPTPPVHAIRATIPIAGGLVSALPTLAPVAVHPECGCALSA